MNQIKKRFKRSVITSGVFHRACSHYATNTMPTISNRKKSETKQ